MADVDKGARPKDPKTVESQNMGDIIKSLEREEKDLRSRRMAENGFAPPPP